MGHAALLGTYNLQLVALSIAIAVLAAYAALNLISVVKMVSGHARLGWLLGGAISMGTGIWSMHFVGMLAFHLPVEVRYDMVLVLVSMLAAIAASGLALYLLSRSQLGRWAWVGGSLFMGCGIAIMHYTGMAAMHLPAEIHYQPFFLGLSLLSAIGISAIALRLPLYLRDDGSLLASFQKLAGVILLGFAIPTTHYLGMAAAQFDPSTIPDRSALSLAPSFLPDSLATTVGLVTIGVLGIALLCALEVKVKTRTAALVKANQELEAEVLEHKKTANHLRQQTEQLKQAQLQLVQAEKMSVLGTLLAGVAHDIANPLGFVASNLEVLTLHVAEVGEHLALYRAGVTPDRITDHAEASEIEFVLRDLPKLIDSMKLGCNSIKDISSSLRVFSRSDTREKVLADIHDGLDSTLVILHHRLKAQVHRPAITVVRQYGELPEIPCFLGQLNQVFMNLLANAIDAFEEQNQHRTYNEILTAPNIITLSTDLAADGQFIHIRIADNGPGIPPAVLPRIFDNFFTTRSVGKGTGLGLAIAKQIIEETHCGKISVHSTPNQGTEFTLEIPIECPHFCPLPPA